MVSAAEQLVANLNFSAFSKAEELKKRLWFTLGALLVYRLGTYIPLPGINPQALADMVQHNQSGILGLFNTFSGGAVGRMAIFALNIMPYISASIIVQLMTTVSPHLEQLKKEGEAGRKQINQYTRYGTVILATVQAYAIAVGLQSASNIVTNPGWFFQLTTVITLVGGTVFLMWLGEQITARGVGNGISLIIFAGIVARLPSAIAGTLELSRQGAISAGLIVAVFIGAIFVITFIVFMERAQRRLLVQYPKRQIGNKMFQGDSSHLPLKLNTSGVIPPIFASSLLLVPITIANFSAGARSRLAEYGDGPARQGTAALSGVLCARHCLLRLLLHGDRLQSAGHGRQSEEIWRLHSRHSAWSADCGIYRLCADQDHGCRRGLSRGGLRSTGAVGLILGLAVLSWRHLAAHRRERNDGYGGADSKPLARASI